MRIVVVGERVVCRLLGSAGTSCRSANRPARQPLPLCLPLGVLPKLNEIHRVARISG